MNDIEQLRLELAEEFPREAIDLSAVRRVLQDAERYRWLRDSALTGGCATIAAWEANSRDQLDGAIDAAMAKTGSRRPRRNR